MLAKIKLYLTGIGVVALLIGAAWLLGSMDGAAGARQACKDAQQAAKEKTEVKHANIKRKAPGDADKRVAIEWLRQRTRP